MKVILVKAKDGMHETLVDDEDYDYLNQFKWFINGKAGYAVRNIWVEVDGKRCRRSAYMHREIMTAEIDQIVDHINHNRLDNTSLNLRFVTKSQNAWNNTRSPKGKSGVYGVYWFKPRNKWKTNIKVNNKEIHLGYFDTVEEATIVRLQAEKKYHSV